MKLWLKTLFIIGLSQMVLIALLAFLIGTIVLERFTDYEQQRTQQEAVRAADTLWSEGTRLEQHARSWASWDDMYDYIAKPDPSFIATQMGSNFEVGASNRYIDGLETAQMMLFLNTAGDIVWSYYWDERRSRMTELPASLRRLLTLEHPLLHHSRLDRGQTGILLLPRAVWLVASRPIITSQGRGPARGTVIAGRYLDAQLAASISDIVRLPVSFHRVGTTNLPPDIQQATGLLLEQPAASLATAAFPINDQNVAGYALLRDPHGKPGIVLRIEEPRTIYHQGVESVYYLIGALVVVGVVMGSIVVSLLQHTVVRRLTHLSSSVQCIRAQNDLATRVVVRGRDELTNLGESINAMLSFLEHLVKELSAAQAAAEEANYLKSRFIANMSHELRTPLNSIINFTYIIKSGLRGPVTPEQITYLDRVYANGEHLLGLINDILDLAKIEAGRMELSKEPIALDELVKSALSTAIGLTKDKSIALHHEFAEQLPPIVADRTRIRQVLLNLLSNAAKFTDAGSITVRVWQEGNELITSVADTGIGIPADKFNAIFEEFRQADEGSTRSYQGTGLGLSICKRLIELHGGRIWLESTVGTGSTFFFSLPLTPELSPGSAISLPIPGTEQGAPVVVIDDDPAVVEIIRTYLGQDGYAVYGISDSRVALTEVRQLRPVAIVLDILMPYKSGWSVLTELKLDPELCAIPVLLYTVEEEQHRGLSLGASAYLVKPVEAQQLRETVGRLTRPDATILAIDDDPQVLEIVRTYLGQAGGYHVQTASGGQAGLACIAAQRPDLIVLDLMMPEVDGFAVLEDLDAVEETRRIPVVVLTAKDLTVEEQTYLRTRVDGLVSKLGCGPEQWLSNVQRELHQIRAPWQL